MKAATLVGVMVLGVASVPALAADLPSRKEAVAPVAYAPVFTWTGFYLGVNAGAGWQNKSNVYVTGPLGGVTSLSTGNSSAGFVGGGQIGYNYQVDSWVFGAETDIQYADVGGKLNWGPYTWWGGAGRNSNQYFGTVRARVGYAVDRTLFYVTGGLAYGGLNGTGGYHSSNSNAGWTVGGGVEYAFTQNWTAKLEGLYVNLNNSSKVLSYNNPAPVGSLPAGIYTASSHGGHGGGIMRVGVNYKF